MDRINEALEGPQVLKLLYQEQTWFPNLSGMLYLPCWECRGILLRS